MMCNFENLTVSTHSRPKAAAVNCHGFTLFAGVSTHSHPKVAASAPDSIAVFLCVVSTHSHPKVAAARHFS